MEQLVTLFADISGSKSREENQSSPHQLGPHIRDAKDARDSRDHRESRDARDTRRAREPSRSTRDPSRSTRRDASRSTRNTQRESREFRDSKEPRDSREPRDTKDTRDARDNRHSQDARYWEDTEAGPPPYQEIADAVVHPPTESNENELPLTHPAGISTTERRVNESISVPVDWVIHPSAPHFVICGRCYVDRIYLTQQWRREFVKYKPTTGMLLRCHLGAIPHMDKRWSKVHTADDFLSFLKIMQRKKVAKPCPGGIYPRGNITWYTAPSVPGLRICQECRRRLFGGTALSKFLSPSDTSAPSVCHGSFNYTNRMVDQLLEDNDWDHFAEGMRIRIRLAGCPGQKQPSNDVDPGWWYKYTKSSIPRDLYICEACFFDYAHKTDKESNFSITDSFTTKPWCIGSLRENQMPETADIEYSRTEVMRLLHGTDRRCYAQGTTGLKWYTTLNNPQGYGICHGCYHAKIKPIGGEGYFVHKRDIGKRTSFTCWMNSYHPFFKRHQQLIHETLITGDASHLENSIRRFSRLPGCQQGGMGQGKNKRWWGWRCLRICAACMKGGNITDTPAAKKFELHGEKDPYYRVCGLYSMQLRDRFFHEDLTELLEFAKKREEMLA